MRSFPFLLALGCAGSLPTTPAPEPPVELRTWELPPGYAARLAASLQRVLDDDSSSAHPQPVGRAEEGPGGTLVVVGPAGVLDGVDGLVRRASAAPPVAPPRNVEVEFWVVRGTPSASPTREKSLDSLAATLDAVQGTDGPLALSLVAKRRLETIDGERGELTDDAVSITQTLGIEPGTTTVVADASVRVPYPPEDRRPESTRLQEAWVRTRLSLSSGTVAILSQAWLPSNGGASSLYILVRPTILD
jgi:hypothetical protein